MITKERAKEIVEQAKALSDYGPWSDKITHVLTTQEKIDILDHWNTMSGESCYMDAFNDFLHGRVENKQ